MSHQVGTTVVAIRDGDEETLNIFGEGVYVGDLPREDTSVIPAEIRALIEGRIATDDAYPIEQHPLVKLHESFADNLQETPEDVAKVAAMVAEDRAKPFEQRVTTFYAEMMRNPCIYLDSGDIVWGAQCWWGPRDETLQRFARAQINTVPVPEGNGRWK